MLTSLLLRRRMSKKMKLPSCFYDCAAMNFVTQDLTVHEIKGANLIDK